MGKLIPVDFEKKELLGAEKELQKQIFSAAVRAINDLVAERALIFLRGKHSTNHMSKPRMMKALHEHLVAGDMLTQTLIEQMIDAVGYEAFIGTGGKTPQEVMASASERAIEKLATRAGYAVLEVCDVPPGPGAELLSDPEYRAATLLFKVGEKLMQNVAKRRPPKIEWAAR